jgi:hypothetical protein
LPSAIRLLLLKRAFIGHSSIRHPKECGYTEIPDTSSRSEAEVSFAQRGCVRGASLLLTVQSMRISSCFGLGITDAPQLIKATKEQQALIHKQQEQIRAQQNQIKAQQRTALVQRRQIAELASQARAVEASLKVSDRNRFGVAYGGSEGRGTRQPAAIVDQK